MSTASEGPGTDELATAFDLVGLSEHSLTRFARVYRGRTRDGTEVVVKRTPAGTATAMARWVRGLAASGIDVVTPMPGGGPRSFGPDETWVMYPFVAGESYRAEAVQVRQAGELLGAIHAAPDSARPDAALRRYEFPQTGLDEVSDDLLTLRGICDEHAGSAAAAVHRRIVDLGHRWHGEALPMLRAAAAAGDLVWVAGTDDYKANNLVYADRRPVVVDPDNGGVLPRVLDLALAVVLFHNECATAPGRLFDAADWHEFAAGYRSRVQLTDVECRLWPQALLHQWWEEGTWALEDNDAQAWSDARQREFLLDLAAAPLERFAW